jgi:hypothetical protein
MFTSNTLKSLFRGAMLALAAVAFSGCSDNPTPSARDQASIASTRFAVTKMGEGFQVEGCQVQPWRVNVTGSLPNFTMATVKCPTASVTATSQNCGKGCTSEYLAVNLNGDIPPTIDPAQLRREQERTRMKQELAELQARMSKLQDELAKQ